MPKSFSMDLNQFTLYRSIGSEKDLLKTRVDRSDIIACLNQLGYSNIAERGMVRARHGIIPSLEDIMAGATLGIPSNARVEVRVVGRQSNHLLFTFIY